MGADLYIAPVYERQRQQWEPLFEKAVRRRDSANVGTEERRQAQVRVHECYERMHECGYFRDPYNDLDLLLKFGFDWWADVIPMLDDGSRLPVREAQHLLEMLKQREEVFELNLSPLPQSRQRYFRDRYGDLQRFLRLAVELDEPIHASL
jgi:hypothetical protein